MCWANAGPLATILYSLPPQGRHWADDQTGTEPMPAANIGPTFVSVLGQYWTSADMFRGILLAIILRL